MTSVGINHYIILAAVLFVIGVLGIFINRRNFVAVLMSLELMLIAISINFVAFSVYLHNLVGQVFALMVVAVFAAEVIVGLAVMIACLRDRGSISLEGVKITPAIEGQAGGGAEVSELIHRYIAKAVRCIGRSVEDIQTGCAYHYMFAMIVGLVVFVAWFWMRW